MKPDNDPKQIKLRNSQYNLLFSGMAVIAFGVWSIIRAVFFGILENVDFSQTIQSEDIKLLIEQEGDIARLITNGFLWGLLFIGLLLDLLLRLYIGRSAIKDARGKKKSPIYIGWAAFLGIGTLFAQINQWGRIFGGGGYEDATMGLISRISSSFFVDITSGIAFIIMFISAVEVRDLRKKLQEEAAAEKEPEEENSDESAA